MISLMKWKILSDMEYNRDINAPTLSWAVYVPLASAPDGAISSSNICM